MIREQTYQLPITVIIEVMKGLHEPVTLRARVSTLSGHGKLECIAHIVVNEQGLQTCVITEQGTGARRVEGEEAFGILQRSGTLSWTLQPAEAASTLTRSPPTYRDVESSRDASQIPFRQVELTTAQMQALPPAQKKVFALVNGKNTIASIAHLLTKTPHEVLHVLLELKQKRLITL
jgi:hypothetical protein